MSPEVIVDIESPVVVIVDSAVTNNCVVVVPQSTSVTTVISEGTKGDTGRTPDILWSGDQISVDGTLGPHLTGPQGVMGDGDMNKLIYDPNGIYDDAFDAANLRGNIDGGTFN